MLHDRSFESQRFLSRPLGVPRKAASHRVHAGAMDLFTSIFGGGGAVQQHEQRQEGFFDLQDLCGVRPSCFSDMTCSRDVQPGSCKPVTLEEAGKS